MIDFKLYIAGPMSAFKDTDFNYGEFERAAQRLRRTGFTVISPHEVDTEPPGSRHYTWYIRNTLAQLLRCDAVAVLNGIHWSTGALHECTTARLLKMHIETVREWENIGYKIQTGALPANYLTGFRQKVWAIEVDDG